MFWKKKQETRKTVDLPKTKRPVTKKPEIFTGPLKLEHSNCQHVGKRENQEDAFAFSDLSNNAVTAKRGIFAVLADGMGGLANGEIASQAAVKKYLDEFNKKDDMESASDFLKRVTVLANAEVYDLAFQNGREIELGTTVVAVLILEGKMNWISVGDSRIYIDRSGLLSQVTTDHVYANHLEEQVFNGTLSGEEAAEHPERNFLTSYLGIPELVEVNHNDKAIALEPGDKVVLCSDGLYDTLSEDEITAALEESHIDYAQELVRQVLAKNNPYQDNVTVIVLHFLSA